MHDAATRTAVPELIAGNPADDALEVRGVIQHTTERRTVDVQRISVHNRNLGEAWAQAEAKQKKADIARAMQDVFAHGDGIPAGVTAESRAAAIAWTPPGFCAFDTGAVDDRGSADDEGTSAPDPQPAAANTPLGNAPEDDGPDPSGVEAETSQAGDPEASAPADSQRLRKRIEEGFGWIKTTGGLAKTRHRGLDRVGWMFTLTAAAYNLVRLRKLLAEAPT